MRRLLPLLLLASVFASVLEAAEIPRIELDSDQLVLTDLPPILDEKEVKEHLMTGLTTSVHFRPDGKTAGGALVEIRYDLWDEVFHVAALGFGSRAVRAELSSLEDLRQWWRQLRLRILDGSRLGESWPSRLKVTARVVPFSQSEEADTQRWFSESIGRRSGTGELGRSAEKEPETLRRTFNLLLATAIRRRPLVSFSWNVSVPPPSEDSEEKHRESP